MNEKQYGKYEFNEEENAYRDVINQMMNSKTTTAYVYNKNIADRLKKEMSNLEVTKKDFYWEVKRKDKEKKLLKRREVYETFYISRTTLDKWLDLGCPVHIVGNKKYFIADEIEEWIKSK